jgi:hypothetical protein
LKLFYQFFVFSTGINLSIISPWDLPKFIHIRTRERIKIFFEYLTSGHIFSSLLLVISFCIILKIFKRNLLSFRAGQDRTGAIVALEDLRSGNFDYHL